MVRQPGAGQYRISDDGGEPEQLTDPTTGENIRSHRWPHLLPGGKAVLFTVQPNGVSFDEARIEVLDLTTMERSVVANGGSFPLYASTGHVTYIHESTMFAVPFDLDTLETRGSPVPVVEQVSYEPDNGGGRADFSPQGHLVYVSGAVTSEELTVVWIDLDETVTPLLEEPRDYNSPRISPDGSRLAIEFTTTTLQEDVWIYDLGRGAMSRLTFDGSIDMAPIWSPDGRHIVFSSLRGSSVPNLHWKLADGGGDAERLAESKHPQFPTSFSPDGKYLMFRERGSTSDWDLLTLRMEDREVEVFLRTEFIESNGEFSPDGKWISYDSNESGRWEAYVRPFPAGGGRWQISTEGGGNTVWSRDGKTLYYGSGSKLMAVSYTTDGGTFRPGPPRVVLDDGLPEPSAFRDYDISQDGRVITTIERDQSPEQPVRARVVLNWFEELAERVN